MVPRLNELHMVDRLIAHMLHVNGKKRDIIRKRWHVERKLIGWYHEGNL